MRFLSTRETSWEGRHFQMGAGAVLKQIAQLDQFARSRLKCAIALRKCCGPRALTRRPSYLSPARLSAGSGLNVQGAAHGWCGGSPGSGVGSLRGVVHRTTVVVVMVPSPARGLQILFQGGESLLRPGQIPGSEGGLERL